MKNNNDPAALYKKIKRKHKSALTGGRIRASSKGNVFYAFCLLTETRIKNNPPKNHRWLFLPSWSCLGFCLHALALHRDMIWTNGFGLRMQKEWYLRDLQPKFYRKKTVFRTARNFVQNLAPKWFFVRQASCHFKPGNVKNCEHSILSITE